MILRALIAGLFATAIAGSVEAAEISTGHEGPCQTHLSGPIVKGDAATLRQMFTDRGVFQGSVHGEKLCLDSRGGSIAEGLRIGRILYELGIPTRLEKDATCLSSCAIAFMMGTIYLDHSSGDGANANRRMHHTATLGFHRPELNASVAERNDNALLGQAFDLAIQATLEFVDLSNFRSYRETMIPSDLIQQMFAHRGQEFFLIDTTGKAGRWHIGVDGVTWPYQIDKAAAFHACDNLGEWQSTYFASKTDPSRVDQSVDVLTSAGGAPVFAVSGSHLTDEFANECLIRVTEGTDELTGEGPIPVLEACGAFPTEDRFIGKGDCQGLAAADPAVERWRTQLQNVQPRFDTLALLEASTPLRDLPDSVAALSRAGAAFAAQKQPPLASLRNRCRTLGLSAEVRGVQNFTNLRARPGLDADTVGQAYRGERVRPVSGKVLFWSTEPDDTCETACNYTTTELFHLGSSDPAVLAQCFENNKYWYEVTTPNGTTGFVSGKFLKY